MTLDTLAMRYGKLPSELMQLDAYDFSLLLLVASKGIEAEEKAKSKRPPIRGRQPVKYKPR